jgi:hypothetical protein
MEFINLTPHQVSINGRLFPPPKNRSQIARVEFTLMKVDCIEGVDLIAVAYSVVRGLPEPQPDTIFIVSSMVRTEVPHRTDVASPRDQIKNEYNQIVGCRSLMLNKPQDVT